MTNPSKRSNSVWTLTYTWMDDECCASCGFEEGRERPELLGIYGKKEDAIKERDRRVAKGFQKEDFEIKEWELQ